MSQQDNNNNSNQDSYGNDWQNSSSQGDWISSAQPSGGFFTSTPNDANSQQSNSTFKCYEEHWSQDSNKDDSFWARSSQESGEL